MPKADDQKTAPPANPWSSEDFGFALRELRQEFPGNPGEEILASVQSAAQRISEASGRVRLVQTAREVLRENARRR